MVQKLFKKLKMDVSLARDEKTKIKGVLFAHMQKHPVRNSEDLRPYIQRSENSLIQLINSFKQKPMPIILAILIVFGAGLGGTSLAAEDSLPGDTLYPVKIHFNENVKSAFAFSQEAEADVEIKKVGKRLEEAGKLAVKGRLTEDAATKLESRFKNHVEKMSQIADKVEAEGKVETVVEIRSRLEAMLNAHEEILEEIRENTITKEEAKETIKEVRAEIKTKFKGNEGFRIRVERKIKEQARPAVKSAAEGKLGAAENKLEEVESFVQKKSDKISSETKTKIDAKLLESKTAIDEGKVKVKAEEYGEAFVLFQRSMMLSQQAKIMAAVSAELNDKDDDEDDDDENSASTEDGENSTTTDEGDDGEENDGEDGGGDGDENGDDEEDEEDEEGDDKHDDEDNKKGNSTSARMKVKTKIKTDLDLDL